MDEENKAYADDDNVVNVMASRVESNYEVPVKRKVGRPRKADSDKVIYQRVPIEYTTYKRMQEVVQRTGGTYTNLIEALAQANHIW